MKVDASYMDTLQLIPTRKLFRKTAELRRRWRASWKWSMYTTRIHVVYTTCILFTTLSISYQPSQPSLSTAGHMVKVMNDPAFLSSRLHSCSHCLPCGMILSFVRSFVNLILYPLVTAELGDVSHRTARNLSTSYKFLQTRRRLSPRITPLTRRLTVRPSAQDPVPSATTRTHRTSCTAGARVTALAIAVSITNPSPAHRLVCFEFVLP